MMRPAGPWRSMVLATERSENPPMSARVRWLISRCPCAKIVCRTFSAGELARAMCGNVPAQRGELYRVGRHQQPCGASCVDSTLCVVLVGRSLAVGVMRLGYALALFEMQPCSTSAPTYVRPLSVLHGQLRCALPLRQPFKSVMQRVAS